MFRSCCLEVGHSSTLYSSLLLFLSCLCIYRQKLNIKSATSDITFCSIDPKSQLKKSEARIFSSQFNTTDSIRTSCFLSFFFFPRTARYTILSLFHNCLCLRSKSPAFSLSLYLLPPTHQQIARMSLKVGCISKY